MNFVAVDKKTKKILEIIEINNVCGNEVPEKNIEFFLKKVFSDMYIFNIKNKKYKVFINDFYENGEFYPPKPFNSWIFNDELRCWQAPINHPKNCDPMIWNEESLSWTYI